MTPDATARRHGRDAWLVRFAPAADRAAFLRGLALRAALEARPPAGLAEIVPSFTTILCRFEPGRAPDDDGWCRRAVASAAGARAVPGRSVEIPVRYDGADLDAVASRHGMTAREVARLHAAGDYHVHCLGFAPGFPYLGGLDPRLHTPRLAVPRPRVPAGSVAIGGSHAGIYSVASPGGWNLVGTTPARLFRPEASTPADMFLLAPGDTVRFVETAWTDAGAGADVDAGVAAGTARGVARGVARLTVLSAGTGLTVQDAGRSGWSRMGVPPGGAMDPASMGWANRLVDNPSDAPVLELALGRQEVRAETRIVVGLAGADLGARVRRASGVAEEAVATGRTVALEPGDVLRFAGGGAGAWAYVAIHGGVAAASMLGSRATTARAGIGTVLSAGSTVFGAATAAFDLARGTASRRLAPGTTGAEPGELTVRVWPGPQAQDFGGAALRAFLATPWRVSARSDRTGYRLEGGTLDAPAGEMISEPVVPGSVQVPPGGGPIVTMPDGPTMGGYPKIAVVDPDDLGRLAQAAGRTVRFRPAEGAGWPGGGR